MTTIPEEPDSDWTQTAYLFCDRLGIKRKADALHICEGITAAIQAAEKRGREEALFWQKARMRAAFIEVCDKLPLDALEAITNAMNTLSDEMEKARSTN